MAQQEIHALILPGELEHVQVAGGMVVVLSEFLVLEKTEAVDLEADVDTCQGVSLKAVEHVLLVAYAEAYFAREKWTYYLRFRKRLR